jgi:hypothetical protein
MKPEPAVGRNVLLQDLLQTFFSSFVFDRLKKLR